MSVEYPTTVIIQFALFWYVTSSSLFQVHGRFRKTCYFLYYLLWSAGTILQIYTVSYVRRQSSITKFFFSVCQKHFLIWVTLPWMWQWRFIQKNIPECFDSPGYSTQDFRLWTWPGGNGTPPSSKRLLHLSKKPWSCLSQTAKCHLLLGFHKIHFKKLDIVDFKIWVSNITSIRKTNM
jgi:hypothetical protein